MIDLSNTTFNIPVKIDSTERLENLKLVIAYLYHHFYTNIIVYEASNGAPLYVDRDPRVLYVHETIGSGAFHRTKYLNHMALLSRTPYIVNYDCDVLFKASSYVNAIEAIKTNDISGCFPYDGLFLNVARTFIPKIQESWSLDFIDPKTNENFGTNSMGGAIAWNRHSFIRGGMENENFISWGYEDWERIHRFGLLGYKIGRIKGPLYHISHPRGADSSDNNPYYQTNGKIYDMVTHLSKEDLVKYVASLPWMNIFR